VEERIARVEETVAALSSSAVAPKGWGELLTEVAMNLPEDAYLTAFGGEADSVALAGIAEDAGSVLETLRNAPSLRGVRLEAPIRQESRPGETPVERFIVAAKLSQLPRAGGRGGQP
jgi:Tfp pilus assembly protein PilN